MPIKLEPPNIWDHIIHGDTPSAEFFMDRLDKILFPDPEDIEDDTEEQLIAALVEASNTYSYLKEALERKYQEIREETLRQVCAAVGNTAPEKLTPKNVAYSLQNDPTCYVCGMGPEFKDHETGAELEHPYAPCVDVNAIRDREHAAVLNYIKTYWRKGTGPLIELLENGAHRNEIRRP